MAILKCLQTMYTPHAPPDSVSGIDIGNSHRKDRLCMPEKQNKTKHLSKVPSLGSDIATSGHLSYENHHSKDTFSPTSTAALFTAAETQTQENFHRQIKD